MRKIWEYMKVVVMVLLILCTCSFFVWMYLPDNSRRGNIVMILGTPQLGYILSEDRDPFNTRKKKQVLVLYPDHTGQWHEKKFPIEMIRDFGGVKELLQDGSKQN